MRFERAVRIFTSRNKSEQMRKIVKITFSVFCYTSAIIGLYVLSLQNYLLFHNIIEIFSICVAFGVFIIVWNARFFLNNNYILFIGIAYLFVAAIDLLHTLAFKGMGIFLGYDENLTIQLWLSARYLQSISFFSATFFFKRKLNVNFLFMLYLIIGSLLLLSIFYLSVFPLCFENITELTPFKKISEYIIITIFLASLVMLLRNQNQFDSKVLRLIISSIVLIIAAEFMFTLYITPYAATVKIGHLFKAASFYLIYKALIETTLRNPYSVLFRDLKQSERKLLKIREKLKTKVQKRTAELAGMIETLHTEIKERIHAEKDLFESEIKYQSLVESIPAITYTAAIDEPAAILYVSPQVETILGFTPSDYAANRKIWSKQLHPEDNFRVMDGLRSSFKTGMPFIAEYRMLTCDNRIIWIHDEAKAVCGENGKPILLQGVMYDITKSKLMEEELKKYRNHLEDLIKERTAELKNSNEKLKQEIIDRQKIEKQLQNNKNDLELRVKQRTEELSRTIEVLQGEVRDRKLIEDAARESKELFDSFMQHLPGFAFIRDDKGRFLYLNVYAEKAFNLNIDDCIGKTCFELWPYDLAIKFTKNDLHALTSKEISETIDEIIIDDNKVFYVTYKFPIFRNGLPPLLGGISIDITERNHALDALRQSEEKYRELVENANSIIMRRDINGKITFFNEFAQKFFGYTEREILGRNVIGTIVPQKDSSGRDMSLVIHDIGQNTENYTTNQNENICRDGRKVWIAWTNKPINDQNGRVIEILAVGNDITERKLSEQKIFADRQQLRSLTAKLLIVEEEERRNIATGLHDTLGQLLTFLRIELGNLQKTKSSKLLEEFLNSTPKLLDEAIEQTRTLIFDISPPSLYTLGFEAAIEELTQRFSKERKLNCKFLSCGDPKPLSDHLKILLYRSARELLINAAKHAKANNIQITLRRIENEIQIDVEDDGSGFDPTCLNNSGAQDKSAGFGLFSIRERLTHIGGKFDIQSEFGKGTKISLSASLDTKKRKIKL